MPAFGTIAAIAVCMAGSHAQPPGLDCLLQFLWEQATEHVVIILDCQGVITHWLGAAELVFGYKASEVIGQRHTMLFAPEDVKGGAPEKELAIAVTGVAAEDDRWMLRKDGSRFWAIGALQAIRGPDGALRAFGKILRNRTDVKGQIEHLESEIKSLHRGEERKNSFISTLSHELRNFLAAVSNAAQLLAVASPQVSEENRFAVSVITRQVDAMKRLVDDLLDMTRVSAGKVKLQLEEVSLLDILNAAIDVCRPTLNDRTHSLHLHLGEVPVTVNADSVRLQQVFVNLIQNAAKYTEYGGTIWVKLLLEGQDAVVKVEDDGIGISPELLPRIFDLFTQSEFTGDKSGLGIGLSVVRDITQLHGGTATVRSDGVGKGSEFTVRLPLAGPSRDRPDSPARVK
jgi:two-component system CheB/CheR fusion protein